MSRPVDHSSDTSAAEEGARLQSQWRPTASLETLKTRAAMLRQLRSFFDDRNFLEVHTPVLSADTVVDLHLDPFRVTIFDDPAHVTQGPTWFLQTSPEFHMKRLIAAGAESIYQIGPAFRACEHGDLHNLEFTMVEWYRCGDDMHAGMQLLSDVTQTLLACPPAICVRYADVFCQQTGLDPLLCDDERLIERAAAHRELSPGETRDDWLDTVWSLEIEPQLGHEGPTIVYDYPATQAALARVRDGEDPASPAVAERFELYVEGIELANGYHELTDFEEFCRRIDQVNTQRLAAGKPTLPVENQLKWALKSGFPPTTGVAMGFDRVVMLRIRERKLENSLTFPRYRA